MAFYVITKVKGPVQSSTPANVAKEYTILNTETGASKTIHVEVNVANQDLPDAWLQELEDNHAITPNDFGL